MCWRALSSCQKIELYGGDAIFNHFHIDVSISFFQDLAYVYIINTWYIANPYLSRIMVKEWRLAFDGAGSSVLMTIALYPYQE